ncbi:MAG TPA: winged helix-turn-helix domain-containing protein, partial [Pyrinomonadaceae bacterium]
MSKPTAQRVYQFEQFRLDTAHLMLYRDGEPLSLPPKAVETLQALVERNGQIVHKDELMRIIWNDSVVEESNLSLYLHLLRKTLGERADKKPFIETLRRRGYRFSAPLKWSDGTITDGPEDFIGRDKEIAEIANLLVNNGVRLLTLTGVGGVGKTTLAQAAQSRLSGYFPDGVFFVELAAVSRPELIASTIAGSLSLKPTGDRPALETLKEHLNGRRLLLILDNFEQLIPGSAQISELLNAASEFKIVVTSRVHLRLSVDHEFVVPPLAVPSNGISKSIEQLLDYPAVRLFVARARRTKPGFALTNENASTVAEICRRLDGLPLAIELAAARIIVMSPATILRRLEHQLALLTGGPRDLPARQQTMRATLQWSYDLLEEKERRLLACLAVFVGGFTLEAAEAVVGPISETSAEHFTVLDGITSLIEHNLLTSRDQREEDSRFHMLEVVRD